MRMPDSTGHAALHPIKSMQDLDIREIMILRGPNIWANYPVLEAWVDLGSLKDTSSEAIPGFGERLKNWLPGMIEHRCSEGVRGGGERLDRGTYPAHILEHVTLELQNCAGHSVGYGKARHTCVDGLYKVAVRYLDEVVAEACLRTGRELLLAAYAGQPIHPWAPIFLFRLTPIQNLKQAVRMIRPKRNLERAGIGRWHGGMCSDESGVFCQQ